MTRAQRLASALFSVKIKLDSGRWEMGPLSICPINWVMGAVLIHGEVSALVKQQLAVLGIQEPLIIALVRFVVYRVK